MTNKCTKEANEWAQKKLGWLREKDNDTKSDSEGSQTLGFLGERKTERNKEGENKQAEAEKHKEALEKAVKQAAEARHHQLSSSLLSQPERRHRDIQHTIFKK